MKSQRGQISVEMVLVVAVLIGFTLTVAQAFREGELLAGLVTSPWISVAGLIQNGVWGPTEVTNRQHPLMEGRINTVIGEPVK